MEIKNTFRKLKKQTHAVSPVVATLMLVLVSVGAAGAFYVWQSDWQGSIQVQTGENDELNGEGYLTLGGSSTIYPVSVDAATAFMDDFPQYKVEVKSGGSGSGRIGAAEGLIDIGASSSDPSQDFFDKYPNAKAHLIGYDAVVPIVHPGTGLLAIDDVTISILYGVNGMNKNASDCLDEESLPAWAEDWNVSDPLTAEGPINWTDVPVAPGETSKKCTGGPVIVVDRSDVSGTEECFCKKLANELDDTQASDHQISPSTQYGESGLGNPGVIEKVGSTTDALGFAALGLATADGDIEVAYFSPAYDEGASFTGDTISNGTRSGIPSFDDVSAGVSTQSRNLWYITDGEPSGLVAKFIDYVMWTENNINFMHDNGYVSYFD